MKRPLVTVLMVMSVLTFALPSFADTLSQDGWGEGWNANENGSSCGFFCQRTAKSNAMKAAKDTAETLCSERGKIPGEVLRSTIECRDFHEAMICDAHVTVECK